MQSKCANTLVGLRLRLEAYGSQMAFKGLVSKSRPQIFFFKLCCTMGKCMRGKRKVVGAVEGYEIEDFYLIHYSVSIRTKYKGS